MSFRPFMSGKRSIADIIPFLMVGSVVFLVSACDLQQGADSKKNAPGVYKGPADEKLSKDDVETLRGRGKSAYQ